MKKFMKPILFTLGGAAVGFAYYYFIGCTSGTCAIASNPLVSMAYMALVGWLLSGVFGKGCSQCNM